MDKVYYAWPYGLRYHQNLDCIELAGHRFGTYGYTPVLEKEIKKRQLRQCTCVVNPVVIYQRIKE